MRVATRGYLFRGCSACSAGYLQAPEGPPKFVAAGCISVCDSTRAVHDLRTLRCYSRGKATRAQETRSVAEIPNLRIESLTMLAPLRRILGSGISRFQGRAINTGFAIFAVDSEEVVAGLLTCRGKMQ